MSVALCMSERDTLVHQLEAFFFLTFDLFNGFLAHLRLKKDSGVFELLSEKQRPFVVVSPHASTSAPAFRNTSMITTDSDLFVCLSNLDPSLKC